MYEIEKITGRTIPAEIIGFINGCSEYGISIDNTVETAVNIHPDNIEHYIEQRDEFGYDIIPISVIDDDYICLFYTADKIKVIYWNSERALEDKRYGVFVLYDDIENFFEILKFYQ